MGTRRKFDKKLRHPNGKIKITGANAADEQPRLLLQRAALVGKDRAASPVAARAIGVLMARAVVTETQLQAAEQFERDWKGWKAVIGAPAHEARAGERDFGSGGDMGDATADHLRKSFKAASAAVDACYQPALVWSLLETVIMDNVIPLTWHRGDRIDVPELALSALRRGLDALMRHYRLKEPKAA